MSENPIDKNSMGYLRASISELARFFSEKTKVQCPACDSESWHIFFADSDETSHVYTTKIKSVPGMPSFPMYATCCVECGFMRFHNAKIVRAWLNENPEEQGELDLGDGEQAGGETPDE